MPSLHTPFLMCLFKDSVPIRDNYKYFPTKLRHVESYSSKPWGQYVKLETTLGQVVGVY